jgi:3-phosphoshikimate 1-carboxyvinyltransferase
MNLSIKPAVTLRGAISLPSSKSYTIRAFIIAALGGKSKIVNASDCEDVRMARLTCQKLGARLTRLSTNSWSVKGIGKNHQFPQAINVGESGTTLRFLISILTLSPHPIIINARGTLLSRPNHHLIRLLRKHGANIHGRGEKETAPIVIKPAQLKGGAMEIDGTLSSQFISSLLITLPNLKEDSRIRITGSDVVSRPYIDMTREVLKRARVKIIARNLRQYFVKGGQRFRGLKNFIVPDDYGLAAFFLVAASLLKSKVILKRNSRDDLVQADKNILPLLKKMGAKIKVFPDKLVLDGPARLRGGNFNLRDCPDLTPIMAIAALFAKGKTTLSGISHVRAKESNRISDLRRELSKTGAVIKEGRDFLAIYPVPQLGSGIRLNPHNDHRLAMAFCILGIKVGVIVEDVECIAKSYPAFLKDLRKLKGRL